MHRRTLLLNRRFERAVESNFVTEDFKKTGKAARIPNNTEHSPSSLPKFYVHVFLLRLSGLDPVHFFNEFIELDL